VDLCEIHLLRICVQTPDESTNCRVIYIVDRWTVQAGVLPPRVEGLVLNRFISSLQMAAALVALRAGKALSATRSLHAPLIHLGEQLLLVSEKVFDEMVVDRGDGWMWSRSWVVN
jgi:hypothetical protein